MSHAVLPPPKAGRKRGHSDSSSPTTEDLLTSGRTKRLRVAFDHSIDVRILDQDKDKPMDLVREEVRVALQNHSHSSGVSDNTAYDALTRLFRHVAADASKDIAADSDHGSAPPDLPTTYQLKQYIIALMDRLPQLKGCAALVTAILDIDWFTRDDVFVSTYTRFLGTLGTTMPGYLKAILERTVRYFGNLPSRSQHRPLHAVIIGRPQILARLHNAIRYILRLIPSASNSLAEVLSAQFPDFRMASRRSFLAYIRNLFKIPQYVPELRSDVLTLVIERTIKLDVEVQQDIETNDDDIDEHHMGGPVGGLNAAGDNDEEEELSDAESDADSDNTSQADDALESRRRQKLQESVDKLDGVMDMLFDYYTTNFAEGSRLEQDENYDQLLSLFTSFILPTYRSRHPQFLILHFAQINTRYSARFIGHCLQLVAGNSVTLIGSTSAAAYLASFIARAAKLPKYQIQQCVSALGQQLCKYRVMYEAVATGPDLARYPLFYAITQALLYIFCFRWRDLIVPSEYDTDVDLNDYDVFVKGEPTWLPRIKDHLTLAIYSKLNPLKVCSPTVVNQFAAIARHLRFIYVYPLLETNKRLKLSTHRPLGNGNGGELGLGSFEEISKRDTALTTKTGESHFQLDAFFPFDPYLLPRSSRWLQGDYVEWKGVPGMDKSDDMADDDVGDLSSDTSSESDSDEDANAEEDDPEDEAVYANEVHSESS